VVLRGAEVLLVKRAAEPMAGAWSLPGGRLEVGETVEQAVVREAREETGLEVEPRRLLGVYDLIDREADGRIRYHFVLVDWICTVAGGELRAGDDAADVRWAHREALEEFALADFTLHAIEKAFHIAEEDGL
jgi:mutator protein MutT